MPQNKYFKSIDDKVIIGKSSIKKENYDLLVFAARNIKYFKVPESIEVIQSCAFQNCNSIKKIDFLPNSKLSIINDHAFYYSSIQKIIFPSNVARINSFSFDSCSELKQVEFSPDSSLQIIENNAFGSTMIESIIISSKLEEIHTLSFYG